MGIVSENAARRERVEAAVAEALAGARELYLTDGYYRHGVDQLRPVLLQMAELLDQLGGVMERQKEWFLRHMAAWMAPNPYEAEARKIALSREIARVSGMAVEISPGEPLRPGTFVRLSEIRGALRALGEESE
ncbi:hypothetical protein ACWDTT_15805 [Streptosporangium sandarakinum]